MRVAAKSLKRHILARKHLERRSCASIIGTVRILQESPCGGMSVPVRFRGKCIGGWTKGLLLVESSMTHQGVTPLHTD
jgi:hypothetical protein